MPQPRQLALSLPHPAALGRADFLEGPGNRAALAVIDAWPDWQVHNVLLVGPAGSGKSHLVEIWRSETGAARIQAARLTPDDAQALVSAGAVAVEDIDRAAGHETALFHLLNLARERQAPVLLTSRRAAGDMPVVLADLASRLRAAQQVNLEPPDETLLAKVLVKLFADRQIRVEPPVIDFILRRMDRSFEAAARVVERLDQAALAEGRAVTRPLAAPVLLELFGGEAPSA